MTNVTELNLTKSYLNIGNFTLKALNASIVASKFPVKACSPSVPVFNGSVCVACPNGTYILLNNYQCYVPPFVTNITELNHTGHYINSSNVTLQTILAQIKKAKFPVKACPASKPLYDGTKCMGCPSSLYYFDLSNNTCYLPKNVSNISALAISHRFISQPNHTLLTIEAAINASKLPVNTCPSTKPLYNNNTCVGCPQGEYFDLKNLTCYKPKLTSNVTALNLTGKAVSIGIYSLKNMASNISNSVLPLKPCNSSVPLFNGTACIACNSSQFYDLRSLKCISSRLVSNVKALNATNKTVATGQYTLAYLQKQINSQVLPTKACPTSTPLFNGSSCVACAPNQYYLIETLKCYTPVYSSNVGALTTSGNVV